MRVLQNLPDWLNPIFVKDLRLTIRSTSFWIINALGAVFLFLYTTDLSANTVNEDYVCVLSVTLSLFMLIQTQRLCRHWAKEDNLEQISPGKITALSAWRIIGGRLAILFTVLVVTALVVLLILLIAVPDKISSLYCNWIFPLIILQNMTYATCVHALSIPGPSSKNKKIGAFLENCFFILIYLFAFFAIISGCAENNAAESKDLFLFMIFVLIFIFGVSILFWHSKLAAIHANRGFLIRLCSPVLLAVLIGLSYICFPTETHGVVITVLLCAYILELVLLLTTDSLQTPERLKLDAPKNFIGKAIWYFCGTGSLCAWIYSISIIMIILFFLSSHYLNCFVAYLIIYAAITLWLRMCFPKFLENNGSMLFLIITFMCLVIDHYCNYTAYVSPLSSTVDAAAKSPENFIDALLVWIILPFVHVITNVFGTDLTDWFPATSSQNTVFFVSIVVAVAVLGSIIFYNMKHNKKN